MWTGMNPQPSADSNSLRSTLQKLETSSVGSNQAFSILVLMMAEESAVTLLLNQPSSWERCDQKTERTWFGDRHGLRSFVDYRWRGTTSRKDRDDWQDRDRSARGRS